MLGTAGSIFQDPSWPIAVSGLTKGPRVYVAPSVMALQGIECPFKIHLWITEQYESLSNLKQVESLYVHACHGKLCVCVFQMHVLFIFVGSIKMGGKYISDPL